MGFNEYQRDARSFDRGGALAAGELIHALGLSGECGEVTELLKKHYRDASCLDRQALAKELGDVLWYVAAIASDHGLELSTVAMINLSKLQSRQDRGTLAGSGNDR